MEEFINIFTWEKTGMARGNLILKVLAYVIVYLCSTRHFLRCLIDSQRYEILFIVYFWYSISSARPTAVMTEIFISSAHLLAFTLLNCSHLVLLLFQNCRDQHMINIKFLDDAYFFQGGFLNFFAFSDYWKFSSVPPCPFQLCLFHIIETPSLPPPHPLPPPTHPPKKPTKIINKKLL